METNPMEIDAFGDIKMETEYFFDTDTLLNDLETQPTKRRKKTSIVWDYFTIVDMEDGVKKACCNNCQKLFTYDNGSKVLGTSHIKRHIAKGSCPVTLPDQNHNPLNPLTTLTPIISAPRRRYKTTTTFNPATCRQKLAQMMILHDYPLHMVEHAGFMAFAHNLNPVFEMGNYGLIQDDCVAIYLNEKERIRNLIEGMPGCISLTLDLWNTSHTTGYVFVTGQFIDSEWKMHRKLLNVVMEPYPDSDSAFSHAVSACLSDWNIERKLFSLTINQPLSESSLNSLRNFILEKSPNVLNGQLLLTNCLARSLTFIAQNAINASQETVKKVRDCVKYVKTWEPLEEKFLALKQELKVTSTKSLSLDDQRKWNTTYEMLVSASELKEVFACDALEPDYKISPTREDWKVIDNLCVYLKLLYNTANLLTSSSIPTTDTFFHEAWKLQLELARASSSEDDVISGIRKPIQENFDKYWNDCCFVLAIAVVMDPRFKMELVRFSFTRIYGDKAVSLVETVKNGIYELFSKYVGLSLLLALQNGDSGVVVQEYDAGAGGSENGIGLTDFEIYMKKSKSQDSKSELDQYLEESVLPRIHEFDVMGWWKLNRSKYPNLSKMAHDVLTIPVSSVGPESVFETGVKEMDRNRCELRPEMVEALFCAKDWMLCEGVESMESNVKN